MTLEEFKTEYASNIRNYTVANLKADREFMRLCRDFPELRDWVLSEKPDMANEDSPKIKFRRPDGIPGVQAEKPAHVEPEDVPKVVKHYRDVVKYAKKKGIYVE
jgi:hypothetical protein